MRAKRRTLRAYLVEPFKQIRFGLHVVSVSLTFAGIFAYLFLDAYREQYQQVFDLFQVADQTAVLQNDIFFKNRAKISIAIIAFVAITLIVVIRRTHRMYGPMISMMRFVSELKRGNYAVRINIRERDDFQKFVSELNALAEELQKKHGVPNQTAPTQGMDSLDERLRDFEDGVIVVSEPPDRQTPPKAS
jgi:signal transduction histidine kinase